MNLDKAVQFWRVLESIWRVIVQLWQGLARQHFISGHQHGGRKRADRQTRPIPPNAAEDFHMFLFT